VQFLRVLELAPGEYRRRWRRAWPSIRCRVSSATGARWRRAKRPILTTHSTTRAAGKGRKWARNIGVSENGGNLHLENAESRKRPILL